jgi:nitroreductase
LDTFDAIKTRRAIKKFDPSHKMSPEEIKFLMELAILAPTSYNQQNWRFITATDQDVKDKISKAGTA